MPRPFKKKTLRDKLEDQLTDLAGQTDELRKQIVDKAPSVRDQIIAALPDKEQLLDLRDDLFDKLPDNVQEKLPEKVKPKRRRLRKVAAVGVVTGAGAAVFAILKRRGATSDAYVTPPTPAPAPMRTAPVVPSTPPTAADVVGTSPADDDATKS